MSTKNDNEIVIKYKIGKEEKIRIFGDKFVENNKDNFQMIINDNIYELNQFYNIQNEKENEILELKLRQLKDVTNISYMFSECSSLIEISDISEFYTNNITDMNYIFNQCSELLSLPDISNWNTRKVNNMRAMFNKCSKLSSLPDISKWNTDNVIDLSGIFQQCSSLTDFSRYFEMECK